MLIITNRPEKYKEYSDAGGSVISNFVQYYSADRIASEQDAKSFRDLVGTRSGACVIIGMGASRKKLVGKNISVPIFAINRAIVEFPQSEFWCAHDVEALTLVGPKVPTTATLITYAVQCRTPSWDHVKHLKKVLYEIFTDPRRNTRRPLFWNETTFGPTIDLAIRMGFTKIYIAGVDNSVGSYVSEEYDHAELVRQHLFVQGRIKQMFDPFWVGAWNPTGAKLIDLSGDTYMPIESGDITDICEV